MAQRTVDGTSGAAAWEIRASATKQAIVRELGVALAAATASTFGIGRPAAIGVTPTTPVEFQDMIGGPVAGAMGALAWGTGPTLPAAFLRRIALPATVGASYVFDFTDDDERGALVIPIGGSIVLWNLAANALADVWAVLEEST